MFGEFYRGLYVWFNSIVVKKKTFCCDLKLLKYIEICVVAQNMTYLGKRPLNIYTQKECVFYCCWMQHSINVNWVNWLILLLKSTIFFLISLSSISFSEKDTEKKQKILKSYTIKKAKVTEILYYNCTIFYFSLTFYYFFLQVLWVCAIGDIKI